MSISPEYYLESGDTLSVLLRHIDLHAKVYLRAEFCGRWALDSSGQYRAPFHLITRGTGWLHTEGQSPQQLTGGELVIFPRDTPHTISHSEEPSQADDINRPPPEVLSGSVTGLMCGYFEFNQQAAELLLKHLPDTIVLDLRNSGNHRDTATLIQLWLNECTTQSPGVEFAVDQLAYVVFVHMLREQIATGALKGPLGALSDPRLGSILHSIHIHPGADHSVGNLAKSSGMSRSAFAQRFKEKTGTTPAQYVTHWRMQQATRMLQSGDESISTIAETVGYQSEVAFRKAYRAYTGQTPGKSRRGS